MSTAPILQAGDIIHLAMPPSATKDESRETGLELINIYAALGITVSMVTHIHGLAGVVVVSVIRKPNPA